MNENNNPSLLRKSIAANVTGVGAEIQKQL